ncbi:MAG: hypothetical protein JST83_06550 [Bacteroidetes bacterium]|nr:hypothetical protein [Bacteroidota bacterium]
MPSDHVDHCTGAVPVSLMDSVRYPSRKFHLADRIGYDEFTDESLSITIAHENCDWAVFHVSIFTKAIRQNTSDTAYWSTIAAERLEGISTAIDPTMGIDSLCYYLRHYTDSTNLHLADSKGVVYEKVASDFMSILTIDTIEKPDT